MTVIATGDVFADADAAQFAHLDAQVRDIQAAVERLRLVGGRTTDYDRVVHVHTYQRLHGETDCNLPAYGVITCDEALVPTCLMCIAWSARWVQ